ncbi:MAG: putative toxin-antitoxin system toxin component, PIN family [Sphingobacteriaceae bacterium]|nr:MAG: putative toxin-antitoxin system toxin component, PIN family [Sphingobacteriaceae bacterium]
MRIILDTNVVVSALIQKSYPFFIVDKLFSIRYVEVCISKPLFAEYLEVLNRDKFSRFIDFHIKAQVLLAEFERNATMYFPTKQLNILDDNADNRLLELAEVSKADYLVTGNTNDFTMENYQKTKIISPKAFFEIII